MCFFPYINFVLVVQKYITLLLSVTEKMTKSHGQPASKVKVAVRVRPFNKRGMLIAYAYHLQ